MDTMMDVVGFYPELNHKVYEIQDLAITEERKQVLQKLVSYIQEKKDAGQEIHLNFICTHNSRRSQFSQIWAKTAADYYGIEAQCYSAGVEVTAFNERAVASIQRFGFRVTSEGEGNPRYSVLHSAKANPIVCFSKVYDDASIPEKKFAAVMTCSHADENCPFIPNADARIPVRFEDPKAFDDTEKEAEMYDTRSMQIASEMFYVFSKVQ